MWASLLLLLFSPFVYGGVVLCPDQSWQAAQCNVRTIVLLDAGNELDFISMEQYMDFLWNNMLPHWAVLGGQRVSFTSFGASTPSRNPFVSTYNATCVQQDDVRADMFQNGGKTTTLTQGITQMKNNYQEDFNQFSNINIMVFSAARTSQEIDDANTFLQANLPNVKVLVIGLGGNYQLWKNFNAAYIIAATPRQLQDNNIINKNLLCQSCGGCPTVATISPPIPTPFVWTNPTAPPPATGTDGPTCSTSHSGLWLDIMFLLDSSSGNGYDGLQEMLSMVQSNLAAVTLVKDGESSTKFSTRIGLATYSNYTRIYGDLYSMDKYDLNGLKLYYDTLPQTNLDSAIRMASAQFDDPNAHRANVQKVIVILGHAYQAGNYPSPNAAADEFKKDGGIIVVYDYYGQDPTLTALASPFFYLDTATDYMEKRLIVKLVLANCFCPPGTQFFTTYPGSNVPTSGCYVKKSPANFAAGSNQCKILNSGIIAQNKNSIKTGFIQGLDKENALWCGAALDSTTKTWEWNDGSQVDLSTVSWVSPPQPGQSCAALQPNGQWVATDCRNSYDVICEVSPCDTSNYCQ